jgi:hypothetical protein
LIPLEFSDFFTREGGLDAYYGCHFPKGWNDLDWNDFDTFMAESIVAWLKSGHKIKPRALSEDGWKKQFIMNYGEILFEMMQELVPLWIEKKEVKPDDLHRAIDDFYDQFGTGAKRRHGRKKRYAAIQEWCDHFEIPFQRNVSKSVNSVSYKTNIFGEEEKTPF